VRSPDYRRGDTASDTPVRWPSCVGPEYLRLDRTFGLDEVPQALAYVGEGRALGKVVVTPL
jgi:hypothetical protein